MKLLTLVYLATHGDSIVVSGDQCRALRQAKIGVAQCHQRFASLRAESANFSTPTAAASPAQGSTSTAGPSRGRPSGSPSSPSGGPGSGADAGGSTPGASSPGSGESASGGSPGSGTGSPGNPGGGDRHPSEPIVQPPPDKPTIDLAGLAKLRGEIRDAARQAVIDRIIHGQKPPDTDSGKPDRPGIGKPGTGFPGYSPGPGGMRGQASPKSSGGAAWAGQAR